MENDSTDQSHAELSRLFSDLAAELGDPKDPKALYNRVIKFCRERFSAEASSLYLEDPGGQTITMVAGEGYSSNIVGTASYQRKEGITGHVWAVGVPFKADSHEGVVHDPDHWHAGKMDKRQWFGEKHAWSLIVVPLKIGNRVLGVLKVENKKTPEPAPFSANEFLLLQALSTVVAFSVETARLAEKTQYTFLLDTLQRVIVDISGEESYHPNTLYAHVVTTCRQNFEAEAASLYLDQGDRQTLTLVAAEGYSRKLLGKASYGPDEGITGYVWAHRLSLKCDSAEGLHNYPFRLGKYDALQFSGKEHCRSLIAVPVKLGTHVIGVLKVENKVSQPSFTDGEVLILQMIATIVAFGVQNATSALRLQEAGLLAYDYAHKSKGDVAVLSNSIRTIRDAILRGATSEADQFLAVTENVVKDLARSAQDILRIAREERKNFEMIPIAELRDMLDRRWAWLLDHRQIEFTNLICPPKASFVADRIMLMAILDSLVQNAIEAINARQAADPDYRGRIGLFVRVLDKSVSLYVCDDALGIHREALSRLFRERFTTKPTGTGLGLTIARRYAEANRGTIEYVDAPPSESGPSDAEWKATFHLSLPRERSARLYSVLIVDDRETFFEFMRAHFARCPGFGDIVYAEETRKALALMESKTFDVVIMDMWLTTPPQGLQACAEIRKAGFQGVLIATSGHLDKVEEAKSFSGIDAVLSKEDAPSIPGRCETLLNRLPAK